MLAEGAAALDKVATELTTTTLSGHHIVVS
jgi:hypothetical protein